MKTWMWVTLVVLLSIPLVLLVVGSFVPRDHVASLTITLAAPPDRVWPVISDFAGTSSWRTDVTRVHVDTAIPGVIRFTESSSQGDIPFEVVSQDPPRKQVVRVVEAEQPFGGTWTWDLVPAGSGTQLTITEAGFVKNPIFRAIGLVFFSPTDTIKGYMRALARKLGETAEPQVK